MFHLKAKQPTCVKVFFFFYVFNLFLLNLIKFVWYSFKLKILCAFYSWYLTLWLVKAFQRHRSFPNMVLQFDWSLSRTQSEHTRTLQHETAKNKVKIFLNSVFKCHIVLCFSFNENWHGWLYFCPVRTILGICS